MLDFLCAKWFRTEVRGLEHVPAHGAGILIANHAGSLPYDSAMLLHAIRRDHPARRDVRPLVEDAVFHLPWLGPLMNRIGGVRACPENAARLLEKDELIAVFPEGVKGMSKLWRDRYRLQRFGRGGFVKLALKTGAPIIPVAVVGAEEALPLLGRVTWFARMVAPVSAAVCAAIPEWEVDGDGNKDIVERALPITENAAELVIWLERTWSMIELTLTTWTVAAAVWTTSSSRRIAQARPRARVCSASRRPAASNSCTPSASRLPGALTGSSTR